MRTLFALFAACLATTGAAQALGVGERPGTLEPGRIAGVVGVPGDPLAGIALIEQVGFVMKDGVVQTKR